MSDTNQRFNDNTAIQHEVGPVTKDNLDNIRLYSLKELQSVLTQSVPNGIENHFPDAASLLGNDNRTTEPMNHCENKKISEGYKGDGQNPKPDVPINEHRHPILHKDAEPVINKHL